MKEYSKLYYELHKHVGSNFDNAAMNKKIINKLSEKKVYSYQDMTYELNRAIRLTEKELYIDNTKHSLFIYGETGTGKTEIIKQVCEANSCVYHKLEIQKIPIEELQGFPYLYKNKDEKTVVRLAPSTILPPSEDDRVWVLHFDEFNKADTESMAAVMNLILNGEIGGSADYNEETGKSEKYSLPKRTVVIGSGNRKIQKNVSSFNAVNNFDTATAERWHRNIYIGYNAPSWLSAFAFKPFIWKEMKLHTRVPSIICYYIFNKYMEEGSVEAPFLIPKKNSDDDEGDSTMSPRAWTLLSNNMIYTMYFWWNEFTDHTPKNDFDSFADYCSDPNVQIEALIENVAELGIENGVDVAKDIIGKYVYFAENRVLPEDVLFDYVNVRQKIKNLSEKKGAMLFLLLSIAHSVNDVKEWEMEVRVPALNLSTFLTDVDIPAEDITVFIYELDKIKTEAAKELGEFLYSINDRYKNAYQGFYYTSDKELK